MNVSVQAHYRYQELAKHFERSDVLFRFKYLLEAQAAACKEVAASLKVGAEYQHGDKSVLALDELMSSLNHLQQQNKPEWKPLLNQLNYLFNNLATVEKQLSNISNPDAEKLEEGVLDDTKPTYFDSNVAKDQSQSAYRLHAISPRNPHGYYAHTRLRNHPRF